MQYYVLIKNITVAGVYCLHSLRYVDTRLLPNVWTSVRSVFHTSCISQDHCLGSDDWAAKRSGPYFCVQCTKVDWAGWQCPATQVASSPNVRIWGTTHVKAILCSFQQGVLKTQYGYLQLPSFQYIFTSCSRCCHLNNTNADLRKSNPEAGPLSRDVHLKVSITIVLTCTTSRIEAINAAFHVSIVTVTTNERPSWAVCISAGNTRSHGSTLPAHQEKGTEVCAINEILITYSFDRTSANYICTA